jgi:restriction endonuclease S subunit
MKWPTVKLKSVTSKVGSGATPKGGEAVYKKAGIPLIRSMNVHFDGFRRDGLVYIDEHEASLLNHVKIQSHDVLFNITGASIGRVTTAPNDMAGARVNQHVCILRTTDKLMPQFLSYYMRSPDQQVLVGSNQIGGTRQAVTKGMLLNWEIPIPPLAEQERIVKLLDESEELRKLRAQADRRTDEFIPALFHEMFGRNLKVPPILISLEETNAPKGWVWSRLTDVARLATGHTPSRRVPEYWNGHIPWISLTDIRTLDGTVAQNTSQSVTEMGIENSSSVELPKGTVCFSRTASVGFVTVMGCKMCTSQDFVNWVVEIG